LAMTYEKMGVLDKALAHWRMLSELGPQAGEYARLASDKIRRGVGDVSQADVADRKAEEAAGFSRLRERALLVIDEIEAKESTRDDGSANVDLKIPVRRQRKEAIDSAAVRIQVDFYDMLEDQHVVLTNADVASQWMTSPANWDGEDSEVVAVFYRQAGAETAVDAKEKRRKYLGYVVRVYYHSQLQDMRANPSRLLDLFPPSTTLNEQNSAHEDPDRR
jgi:hypothetical protein